MADVCESDQTSDKGTRREEGGNDLCSSLLAVHLFCFAIRLRKMAWRQRLLVPGTMARPVLHHCCPMGGQALSCRFSNFMARPPIYERKNCVFQKREKSGVTGLVSWMKDVARSGSLQPQNPILESIGDKNTTGDNRSHLGSRLRFSHMLPYHLQPAAEEVCGQYKLDLAEMEVRTASSSSASQGKDLVAAIDRMESPVHHVMRLGMLMSCLGSEDSIAEWQSSCRKIDDILLGLELRESKIVYEALRRSRDVPKHVLRSFEETGVHLVDDKERSTLREINRQLTIKSHRLSTMSDYLSAKKAAKLQAVSDIYNVIGLSRQKAVMLGYEHAEDMEEERRMLPEKRLKPMVRQIAGICEPYTRKVETLDSAIAAGAFLPEPSAEPNDEKKALWEAHQSVRKLLTLDGVLRGLFDFSESLFGLKVEEEDGYNDGWNKDVRLFHVYWSDATSEDKENSKIGSFLLDPYVREEKLAAPFTVSLSERTHQPSYPVEVTSLAIAPPAWDDEPCPLRWNDLISLLSHFGKVLQLLLASSPSGLGVGSSETSADISEVLANFMVLWVQNDGFLQRLASLSQPDFTFNDSLFQLLRSDFAKTKAKETANNVFLAELESFVFSEFDPRGESTLAEVQSKFAEQYIPNENPGESDLSPLLLVLKERAARRAAATFLCSEIISANIFAKFQITDMTDQGEIKRLGRELIGLLSNEGDTKLEDFEEFCGSTMDPQCVKKVYGL